LYTINFLLAGNQGNRLLTVSSEADMFSSVIFSHQRTARSLRASSRTTAA
jgi:hypothetical protein